ncbi:hypothetical protein Barb7_02959 [Bacteroidales bacterium Barb7]|nr:hypothetical protein Barb7_02959 [Bacteroidales bacterium Barb7]
MPVLAVADADVAAYDRIGRRVTVDAVEHGVVVGQQGYVVDIIRVVGSFRNCPVQMNLAER